jgi:hypothetical protein
MATEFNTGGRIEKDDAVRGSMNPPTARVGEARHWSTFVILGLLAVVIVFGLIFSMQDADTTASNTTPGVTTGTSTPSPSNPPPAPGPKGQGESNSTR